MESSNKMLRLLFVSNFYHPFELGGLEQWCHEVAEGLKDRGHTVNVLTSNYKITQSYTAEPGVVRSLYLQAEIDHYRPIDFFTQHNRQEKHNLMELRQAIHQFYPDLVVIWGMWNLSRKLPYLAEQLMPGRVAYYFAGYWPMEQDIHLEYWQAPARRQITELIKRPLRRIVLSNLAREGYPPRLEFNNAHCCSQFVRDALVNSTKLPRTTGVLFGGIDPRPFLSNPASPRFDDTPLRLLYFGSILPEKGVHTLVEAMGILKKKNLRRGINLTLIGGGRKDYLTELQHRVGATNLSDSVHFLGSVPRDQIPEWLGRFDIFVFSSIWAEPMARTVMEAMAAGLLVVASRAGGQVEMLDDGQNALTFEPGNAEDLAAKLVQVIEMSSKFDQMTRNAREMILERFTLQRMTDELETWFYEITNHYPRTIKNNEFLVFSTNEPVL